MIPNAERILNRLPKSRNLYDPLEKKPTVEDHRAIVEYQKEQARERIEHDIQRIKAENNQDGDDE